MPGYNQTFAAFYDDLLGAVDYGAKADFFLGLIARYRDRCQLILDLACGTGSLSVELAARGKEVIGVDASPEMLSQAREKSGECQPPVLYLCQEMEELDLYGTVDAAICMLDSLNHLEGEEALGQALHRLQYFVEPGGLFLFDMNTPYKHREVLGDNTFVYDTDQVYCVWQNTWSPEEGAVDIDLDFFIPDEKGCYHREMESFREYSYPVETVRRLLEENHFQLLEVQGDYTGKAPGPREERLVYVARRV